MKEARHGRPQAARPRAQTPSAEAKSTETESRPRPGGGRARPCGGARGLLWEAGVSGLGVASHNTGHSGATKVLAISRVTVGYVNLRLIKKCVK